MDSFDEFCRVLLVFPLLLSPRLSLGGGVRHLGGGGGLARQSVVQPVDSQSLPPALGFSIRCALKFLRHALFCLTQLDLFQSG